MNTPERIDTSGWQQPPCGIASTKSSLTQLVDEDYFGRSEAKSFKDSDCGGYPDNRDNQLEGEFVMSAAEYFGWPDEAQVHMLTIQDYVESKLGERDHYSGQDYEDCNVPMVSWCRSCYASLGPWSDCPTNTGYIYCTDCVTPAIGFLTPADFEAFEDGWGPDGFRIGVVEDDTLCDGYDIPDYYRTDL